MSDRDDARSKGEGDRDAARRYNGATHGTARSGEVEEREDERRNSDDPDLRDADPD